MIAINSVHNVNHIKMMKKKEKTQSVCHQIHEHQQREQSPLILTKNLIQPTISLEMLVPSQGHYGFHSFPVVD